MMAENEYNLNSEIDFGIKKIGEILHDFKWDNEAVYCDLLTQIYHYVKHATRVLSYAAAKTSLADNDLHALFLKGIQEEKNHELLAQNDIKALGYDINHFHERYLTTCYYQTLYYNIDFSSPIALLGYFLPLEAIGPNKMSSILPRLQQLYPNATSFFEVHCALDEHHYQDGMMFLKTRSETERAIVEHCASLSCEIFCNMLMEVNHSHSTLFKTA